MIKERRSVILLLFLILLLIIIKICLPHRSLHEELLSLTPHLVDEDQNVSLMRAPSLEEVKNVVFGLSSNS